MAQADFSHTQYKILHLATHDGGGAGRAAYRLHQNLTKAGHQSAFAVLYKNLAQEDIIQLRPGFFFRIVNRLTDFFRAKKKVESLPEYHFHNASEQLSYFPTRDLLRQAPFKPDLIIVHWVSGFLNARNFYELNKFTKAPIFWYFLDAAPFTGGCHYFWHCRNFLTHCQQCPALKSDKVHDLSYENFSYKKQYLKKTDLNLIAGTTYYQHLIKKSKLFEGKENAFIPLGLDKKSFVPGNKIREKQNLGIETNHTTILLACDNLQDKRKGVALALESLDKLYDQLDAHQRSLITLIIAGVTTEAITSKIRFNYKALGFIKQEEALLRVYQATDVYLCSSLEDAGPMMANEAMMCGSVVIGFDIGILPDLVVENETGFIAKRGDVNGLESCLRKFVAKTQEEKNQMYERCHSHAHAMFDPDKQVAAITDFLLKVTRKNRESA